MVLQEGERVTVWKDGLHNLTVRKCNGRYQWLVFTDRRGIEHWQDIQLPESYVERNLSIWSAHDQPQEVKA